MKEHGMLFKPEMIKAIEEGRKTMTRRVMKPQPEVYEAGGKKMFRYKDSRRYVQQVIEDISDPFMGIADVKYNVGDTIYVKESIGRKSPLFMRKLDARIWLEITGVRVERLQEISEDGAVKEGIAHVIDKITGYCGYDYLHGGYNLMTTPYHGFRSLWKSINGAESWEQNPFVFVISFKLK